VLYNWLDRFGTWARVGLLAAGCVACMGIFAIRQQVFLLGASTDPGLLLDLRPWYTPGDVWTFFDRLGPGGRSLYAISTLTLDTLYPILYAGFLGCLAVRLCPPGLGRVLCWVPLLAAVFDLGENVLLVSLALTFGSEPSGLAWIATGFTTSKWALAVVAIGGILVGALLPKKPSPGT
jgi:hypothetical protein